MILLLDNEKRIGIVVGVNEYEASQEQIPILNGAENDAIEIRDRLVKYGNFEISPDHYLIGSDATRKNILKAVSDIFRKDEKCDLIIIYLSGHIILDENENYEAYIAPYDMDLDDPFISGINMADMKQAMYNAKNIASTIIILDCCYAGIATNDTATKAITMMAPQQERESTKNRFATNVEELGKSSSDQSQGKIVLASSEATAVSREKKDCKHSENDSPHSHGAFSYHLIEGLDGKAADSDTGIISIDSLKRYIENQMLADQKQKPIYSIAAASNFDNIKIAISHGKFETKIQNLIKEAEEIFARQDKLIDIFSLQDAAKKVNELITLKQDHPEIPRLKGSIDKSLDNYEEPTINWLSINMRSATEKINSIHEGFYDTELPTLVYELSFDKLVTLPDSYIKALFYITSHVRQNTIFTGPTDVRLEVLSKQLRGILGKTIL